MLSARFRCASEVLRPALGLRSVLEVRSVLRCASTKPALLSSRTDWDLGHPILHRKHHGSPPSASDSLDFGIRCAKLCSLGSSAAGLVMMPVLSSQVAAGAAEKPALMAFLLVANSFLALLAFTPLLLHSLTKRFVRDVYYNPASGLFSTLHYDFLLRRRVLQFRAEQVEAPERAAAMQKLWIPLATCFVGDYPLLLLLDPEQYSDPAAFRLLTAGLDVPSPSPGTGTPPKGP